mmetsp:Transcript_14897/g.56513  ORF Transcript_14897/g.56513 Transcript_14897/m.56513 type:complete len:262 (-) Transcript_14897:694-1479(-)
MEPNAEAKPESFRVLSVAFGNDQVEPLHFPSDLQCRTRCVWLGRDASLIIREDQQLAATLQSVLRRWRGLRSSARRRRVCGKVLIVDELHHDRAHDHINRIDEFQHERGVLAHARKHHEGLHRQQGQVQLQAFFLLHVDADVKGRLILAALREAYHGKGQAIRGTPQTAVQDLQIAAFHLDVTGLLREEHGAFQARAKDLKLRNVCVVVLQGLLAEARADLPRGVLQNDPYSANAHIDGVAKDPPGIRHEVSPRLREDLHK